MLKLLVKTFPVELLRLDTTFLPDRDASDPPAAPKLDSDLTVA